MGKGGCLWLEDQEVAMHGGLTSRYFHSCRGSFPGCGGMPPPQWGCALLSSLDGLASYCPENYRPHFCKVDVDTSGMWRVNVTSISCLFLVPLSFSARAAIPREDQFYTSGSIGNVKAHFQFGLCGHREIWYDILWVENRKLLNRAMHGMVCIAENEHYLKCCSV